MKIKNWYLAVFIIAKKKVYIYDVVKYNQENAQLK